MAEDALEPSTAGVTDNASCQELDALNVNAASADDLHSVGGLAKPMANRIVELRGATGQVRARTTILTCTESLALALGVVPATSQCLFRQALDSAPPPSRQVSAGTGYYSQIRPALTYPVFLMPHSS